MPRRKLVKPTGVGVKQSRHLVNKGAGAACAGTVHALLDAVVKVDDLSVLAAKLNDHVSLGDVGLHGGLGGNHLLDKFDTQPLGKQQAAGAGDGDGHGGVGVVLGGLGDHLHDGGAHVRVMATIAGVHNLPRLVDDRHLHGGRTHVDSDMQRLLCHYSS